MLLEVEDRSAAVRSERAASTAVSANSMRAKSEDLTLIRIAAETWQPFFLIGRASAGVAEYSGIMWDLLLMLTSKLNVSVEIMRPPDGRWGVELPNGSWNGMLGMIQRQEVDMAVGPFAISYPRTKVADFPASIFVLPHRVYLPRPRGSSDLSDFVRLYHPTVWLLILASVVVVSAAVWAAVKVEGSICVSHGNSNNHGSAVYVLLHVWSSLMKESWPWGAAGVSRWLMGVWFLAALVLTNTYSGLLVATLTVPRVPVPIASVRQLVAQRDLPWRLERGGIILHTFKTADVKVYKTLLEGSDGLFPDCFAARRDIAEGRFAGLCDTLAGDLMVAKSFSESGKCDFFSPRENIVTHSYTMVLQKASPFRSLINFWLQELQERGWVDQLIRQRINNGTVCQLPPGKEEGQRPAKSLTFSQMWGVFAIMGVGAGGAAVVFLMEVAVRRGCYLHLRPPAVQ
ncbi:Glutamate receptor ionotropic, delta-1 [Chionoecetes opilio]|uniref:Glutamate receptor ionotropic, delta-1 n=1 Tax=Chionoecetes opilio TaxID=41210 RepID=A0A8J4YHA5_CHIOP|nr:Glutamate receptor ionotropic, delta-1 [Chionoecetes opilio]